MKLFPLIIYKYSAEIQVQSPSCITHISRAFRTIWQHESSSLTKTLSPNSKHKIPGTNALDLFTELLAPLVWHFAPSTLIYIYIHLLRSRFPLEILKCAVFPVWACFKWPWVPPGLAKPAAEEVEAVCVPGTGQEMAAESSSPSAPAAPTGILRDPRVLWTPHYCRTATSWLVPPTHFLCFRITKEVQKIA